ncbi:MAG TPA: PfkB family carbohydrate kinase [Terriglobales bacterium]|nr:PfkB family carbohydrate kinase [Terriglobales bacterium]
MAGETAAQPGAAPETVLAVGSIAFDSIRTPRGAAERVLGGSATYFSLAASHFAPVRIVGVVGEDYTAEHEAVFAGRPICTRGVERAPGKCFFWAGEYEDDPNNRRTLATELNVFASFEPKLPADYRQSRVLFLGNIDPALQCRVRDECAAARLVGGDTMNFWIANKSEEVKQFLARLDLLMINDGEARQLAGEHNLHLAARRILGFGPRAVVIKRGEHGATLYVRDGDLMRYFAIGGYPLEDVCDPTGAGDSFAGGVMGYLASQGNGCERDWHEHLRQAVVYGSVLGSFACERFGIERLRTLTSEEVHRRYREFVRFAHFAAA